MRVTIFGKRWNLNFVSTKELPGKDGDCVIPRTPAEKIPYREMRVHDRLSGQELLVTLIHEFDHAADPEKREEWVEHHAADLGRMLWRLGYRRKGHDDDA